MMLKLYRVVIKILYNLKLTQYLQREYGCFGWSWNTGAKSASSMSVQIHVWFGLALISEYPVLHPWKRRSLRIVDKQCQSSREEGLEGHIFWNQRHLPLLHFSCLALIKALHVSVCVCSIAQLCPTLCNPMTSRPQIQGSNLHLLYLLP